MTAVFGRMIAMPGLAPVPGAVMKSAKSWDKGGDVPVSSRGTKGGSATLHRMDHRAQGTVSR